MTARMLLKSCATPPASWPMASIFCDWRNCSSSFLRSVRSSTKPTPSSGLSSKIAAPIQDRHAHAVLADEFLLIRRADSGGGDFLQARCRSSWAIFRRRHRHPVHAPGLQVLAGVARRVSGRHRCASVISPFVFQKITPWALESTSRRKRASVRFRSVMSRKFQILP